VTASAAARTASIRSGEARITDSPAHLTGVAHRCANSRCHAEKRDHGREQTAME
jgi:hypothetical protein